MTTNWIRSQDRRRNLVAAGSTACLYALAFFGAWLIGSLAPMSLASVPSTVIVDLGGSEGPPGELPQGLEMAPDRPAEAPLGAAPLPGASATAAEAASAVAPIPAPAVPAKAVAAPVKAVAAPKAAAPKATAPKAAAPKASAPKAAAADAKAIPAPQAPAVDAAAVAAEAAAAAAAQEAAAAQAAIEEAAAAAFAAERAAPPKTRTFGSSAAKPGSGAPVAAGGSGTAPGVAGGTGSVTFRGSEMGNALATTFGASSGQVGRNIYVPIYLYMPLPAKIDESIYRNIVAKETFRSHYQQSGSEWRLTSQAPLSQRGDFWTMLESAGYDASLADFKTANKLSPVVLEFAVGPISRNRVELVDVRLVSTSGSAAVDEAVIYGFRQASFFNKTGNAVAGKFVYGF